MIKNIIFAIFASAVLLCSQSSAFCAVISDTSDSKLDTVASKSQAVTQPAGPATFIPASVFKKTTPRIQTPTPPPAVYKPVNVAPSNAPAPSAAPAAVDITPPQSTPDAPPVDTAPPSVEATVQKESKMKAVELPPAIAQLLELPGSDLGKLVKEGKVITTGVPEVLVSGERAGFTRYYEKGWGFLLTDFLSISGRTELMTEPIPIDSLILGAQEQAIRGMNHLEIKDTLTDKEIRHSWTKSAAGTAILKINDQLPVFRYTYDYRQMNRVYDEDLNGFKELDQETYEGFVEYTIPYQLPVLGRWTINAGYDRILMRSVYNQFANEQRNKWIFNNAFTIDTEREIFFGYEYFLGKHEDTPWILKPDQHFFVFQWRQRFPKWKIFSVTNYSATRESFNPDVALYTKHEIFQEFNKDITEKLRMSQRTTVLRGKTANSNFNPDKVTATAIVGKMKLSYEFIKDVDASMTYQQSLGWTTSVFDNALFLWEIEIFKPGLLRTSVGYFWQRFYNASNGDHKDEGGVQFRAFLFQ